MRPARILLLLLCVVVGFVVGAIGSFLQAVQLGPVPVGVVLAVGLTGLVLVGSGIGASSRAAAGACAVGWAAAVLLASSPSGAGDLVVAATGRGLAWIGVGTAVVVASCVPPYSLIATRRQRRADATAGSVS